MLNKANITWSAKQITKMVANNILRFDNIIQRSYVWEQVRKSDLIHSIIVKLFCERVVSEEYEKACHGGVARNANVVKRNEEIQKVWNDFFEL